MLFLLSLSAALAAEPTWWARQSIGGSLFPEGAVSDTRVQLRVPLHRSSSRLFQTTYAGAGARLAVTPVHAELGPRLSIAPVDLFELEVQAAALGYVSWGGRGLLPFGEVDHKLSTDRRARADEQFSGTGLLASATPTVKLKLGPIVMFDSCTLTVLHVDNPAGLDAPWVYEPSRDLIVAWDDVLYENQAGVLAELLPGGAQPLLRVGATVRDRGAVGSGDRSLTVGGLVSFKATAAPAVPTLNLLALAYVIDADRVGTEPNLQLAATWLVEAPLRPAPAGT